MGDYNGWTNKETWLVNLWLGDTLALAREDGEKITPEGVESIVEECIPDFASNGFVADLLNCALGEINYYEIAKHYESEGESV